jgi:NitT/TauT family transport system substrate-binding protein
MITRRSLLAYSASLIGSGLFLDAVSSPALASGQTSSLTLYGPPVGPSVTLAYIAQQGNLTKQAGGPVGFDTYRSPDMLRANFLTGDWKVAITPSYVAANLANKGLPVKLLNIMSRGMIYLLSYDGKLQKPEDLAGETIGMFFRNDMPDLIFDRVMQEKGLKVGKDYALHYVGTPFEALQLLLSGRIKHCVLPEPAATAGVLKGKKLGKSLHRSLDLAAEWSNATGQQQGFPMAGAMVHQDLIDQNPDLVEALQGACKSGNEWVEQYPEEAADIAAKTMPLSASIIAHSIPFTRLTTQRANAIRPDLEAFYNALAQKNPAIIGGGLPDASFYL